MTSSKKSLGLCFRSVYSNSSSFQELNTKYIYLTSRSPSGFPVLDWSGTAPGYLAEDWQLVADVSARRLRSAVTATYVTRRTSNIFGDRCFAAAGPRLWNSLPINLRQCHSLEQFKRLLKTFLFCVWSHGALWHLPKSAPYINLLTYLLTYLLLSFWTYHIL